MLDPGTSLREDGVIYHTYSAYARGVDAIWGAYQWLDRAPKGRNESGPWWRRHDEYLGVMEDRIVALLAHHRDEITAPDLKLAAFMLLHAAHGLIHAVVLQRPKGTSLKHATQEIIAMMTAYLTAPRHA